MPNIISLQFFVPELILSCCCAILLLCSLAPRPQDKSSYIAIIGLLISLWFVIKQFNFGTPPLFWGLLTLDKPAVFFKAIFIITAIIIILFSQRSNESAGDDHPEYYAIITGMVLGMSLLSQAANILMIYLALEFVSLMSFLLVGFVRGSIRSSEAALKYVLFGAVASGVFLYGASLFYGLTGTLDISNFSLITSYGSRVAVISGLLMLAGFLYKIAAVPMHAWCPDAYEGAPTPITAFLSVAPKAAGFAVLMRVAHSLGLTFNWPIIIAVISAATMTFGNLAAIPQENVKRLLAYSSIAHAGYLLMAVACGTPKGNEAVYFYFAAYLLMNLGAFLVVQIVANEFGVETIESYKGLGCRGPYGTVLAITMTIFLLSLTGVPPFIGFIGKFYLFSAVIEAKIYWLAIVGIINSVVSLYYYMRIVKTMFFDSVSDQTTFPLTSRRLAVIVVSLALATTILGLGWDFLSKITLSIVS